MALGTRSNSPLPVIVIHGGAGTITRQNGIPDLIEDVSTHPEREEKYRMALRSSLEIGHKILREGGNAMDAAVAAATFMEDCPLFNAGKGAVFNVDGKNELECSLMLSKPPQGHPDIHPSRRGMALILLTRVRNPLKAARALYLEPAVAPHATLSGPAAEILSQSMEVELVDPSYFFTEERWKQHREGLGLPAICENGQSSDDGYLPKGTIGAVCLDKYGCIAVATSTGGKTNKLVGRIGDTPTFGSGFWAEEWRSSHWWHRIWPGACKGVKRAVGISGTGDGDYFLRLASASTAVGRMRYGGESLEKATKHIVQDLKAHGGDGGLIALDEQGNVAMPLNCDGMYRGVMRADGKARVAIFRDEELS